MVYVNVALGFSRFSVGFALSEEPLPSKGPRETTLPLISTLTVVASGRRVETMCGSVAEREHLGFPSLLLRSAATWVLDDAWRICHNRGIFGMEGMRSRLSQLSTAVVGNNLVFFFRFFFGARMIPRPKRIPPRNHLHLVCNYFCYLMCASCESALCFRSMRHEYV